MKRKPNPEVAVFDFRTCYLRVLGRPEVIKRIKSIYASTVLFHSEWTEQVQVAYVLGFMHSMTVSYQLRHKVYEASVLGLDTIDSIIQKRKRYEE